jgi:hypothetical protein
MPCPFRWRVLYPSAVIGRLPLLGSTLSLTERIVFLFLEQIRVSSRQDIVGVLDAVIITVCQRAMPLIARKLANGRFRSQ